MFQSNSKIIAAIGALTLLLSVSVCIFFMYTVNEKKSHYQEKLNEQDVLKAHEESLKKLSETLEETRNDRETLMTRILEEDGVIDFLYLIESAGKEQGVVLKTESLTVTPVNETFEKLIINLSVSGEYVSVLHVLKLLEQILYQSEINKATIGRDEGRGGASQGLWRGTFELSVTKFKKV